MSLAGKRILLGRHASESGGLEQMLQRVGASVFCVPLIDVVPIEDIVLPSTGHSANIVVITSKNSVAGYARIRSALCPHLLCTVGQRTAAACLAQGISPDMIGNGQGAMALLTQLSQTVDLTGKTILYPGSNLVTDQFAAAASAMGARVLMVKAYETRVPANLHPADITGMDGGVFYSSSGAVHFNNTVPFSDVATMASIAMGQQTADTLLELGAVRVYTARHPNIDALYEAVIDAVTSPLTLPAGENQ